MSEAYNLSVVSIISEQYRADMNKIAEMYGCGDNNLTVKLSDVNGNIFWGCHAYWRVDHYEEFTNLEKRTLMFSQFQQEQQDLFNTALASLYERTVLDGNAQENWHAALAELGLSVVEEPQT